LRDQLHDVLSGILVAAASEIPKLETELLRVQRSADGDVKQTAEITLLQQCVRDLEKRILEIAYELRDDEEAPAPRRTTRASEPDPKLRAV
jgi:predicted RNase H-like nuclease (RuvC/YqgF family)